MKKTILILLLLSSFCVESQVCFSDNIMTGLGSLSDLEGVDINSDGNLDLIVLSSDNALLIMMGDGNGAFNIINTVPLTYCCHYDIESADVNNDGHIDVVVNNENNAKISIYYGDSLGNFLNPIDLVVGSVPQQLTVADLNGDGIADIAVTNTLSDSVSVLLANGSGGFANAVNIPVGPAPQTIRASDFNGDGMNDLVVILYNDPYVSLKVLINNGAGIAYTSSTYGLNSSNSFADDIHCADINGDSIVDIITTDRNQDSLVILFGDVGGNFFAPALFQAGNDSPNSLSTGDFDGDGNIDVAATGNAYPGSTNNTSILLGNGQGQFETPMLLPSGNHSYGSVSNDFNNDGRIDVAVVNNSSTNINNLWIYLNETLNPMISQNVNTLSVDIADATYQWIDCNTNLEIPGANAISYTVSNPGDYAVEVTKNSCSILSECFSVSELGVPDYNSLSLRVYPNPSNGIFNIDVPSKLIGATVEVYDCTGQKLMSSLLTSSSTDLDCGNLQAGVYFVSISGKYKNTTKIIIE